MITVYSPDTQDWSNNGLGVLIPTSCIVKEDAGGAYELELVHPITDDLRWQTLQRGYLIKAPVPERETPFIQQSAEARAESPEHIIWHVTAATASVYSKASAGYSTYNSGTSYHKGAKVNYQGKSYRWNSADASTAGTAPPASGWVKITTGSKRLKKLAQGTELIYHEDSDTYSKVTTPDGTTGYILKSSIAYKRTEPYVSAQPAYNTAVPPRQIRDQVFRIYDVQISDKDHSVTVNARHISYDQLGNVVKTYSPNGAAAQAALIAMSADLLNDHDFNYYTNLTSTITADWARKNAIEAIHDPDNGAVPKLNAQLVRDNYDIFLLENVERDRGVTIAYGKNMLGITSKVNDETAVTRIMPIGYDENGAPILLPELCIDSPYIGDYPTERAIPLDVQEAKVHAAEGDDPGMTLEQAHTKMREAAQSEFDKGCDLVDLELTVDFVHLGDTVEYASMKDLQQVYLYDTVSVRHGPLAILYKTQVIGYEWDSILKRFQKVKMGSIKNGADLGAVAGFQLPSMGISGNKLVPGSVGSSQLQTLSVLNAHIANLSVNAAKIQDLAVETAKIKDLAVETAKIKDAAITNAKIALLAVETANIKDLNVTAAKIADATITAAKILDATITRAKIQDAAIGSAQIDNLAVTTAKIALGAITTALINTGAIGTAQIADASITDGKIVTLTANKINAGTLSVERLIIVGSTQSIVYTINNANGTAQLSQSTIDGGALTQRSITADRIVAGAITANEIAAATIVANNIAANAITAANIASDAIEARHIKAGEITTGHISAPAKAALTLEARESIRAAVTNILSASNIAKTSLATDYAFKTWDVTSKARANTSYALSVRGKRTSPSTSLRAYVYTGDWSWSAYVDITSTSDQTKDIVFTTPSNISGGVKVSLYNFPSEAGGTATYQWAVLAEGNTPVADWTPAPEDTATAIAEAMAQITPEQILLWVKDGTLSKVQLSAALALIESDAIDFRTLALSILLRNATDDVIALFNEQGLDLDGVLSASAVYAPNVQKVYIGPASATWAGDLQSTIDNIDKYLQYQVTIVVPLGTHYGNVTINDYQGYPLRIYFVPGATLVGSIFCRNCKSQIMIYSEGNAYGNIVCTGTSGIYHFNCTAPAISNMRITGRIRTGTTDGSSNGIYSNMCNGISFTNVICERFVWEAIYISGGSTGAVMNCLGGYAGGDYTTLSNRTTGVYVGSGSVIATIGTVPYGNGSGVVVSNGYAPGSETAVRTASPGTQPPAPTTRTLRYTQNDSVTYKKSTSGNWVATGGTYVWRSNSTLFGDQLGMWFLGNANSIASDIGSGTIQAMRVTFQRSTAYSDSTPVSVPIRMHNYATRDQYGNGSSVRPVMSDVIFTQAFARGEAITIDVPSGYWASVKNGTYRGFGVLEGYTVRMDAVCVLEIIVQGGP